MRTAKQTTIMFVACALAVLLALTGSVWADGRRDYYTQQGQARYLNFPQEARAFGMAGSSVVTSTDSASVVGNPAGIGLNRGGDISVTYGHNDVSGNQHPGYERSDFSDNSGMALMDLPLGPASDGLPFYGNFGLGWSGYTGDSQDTIDSDTRGYRLSAVYAKALTDTLSVGYGLGYFNDDLESDLAQYDTSTGFRHTFGVVNQLGNLRIGGDFFFGFSRYNLTTADGLVDNNSDAREIGFDLGASYQLGATLLALSVDYQNYDTSGETEDLDPAIVSGGDEEGDYFGVRVGIEHKFCDYFSGRLGYRYSGNHNYEFDRADLGPLSGSAKYNAWTAGAGFILPVNGEFVKSVKLDYGVEYRHVGYEDWQHVVTLSMPFDLCLKS